MKFFISRLTVHICTLAITALACALTIENVYKNDDTFWTIFYGAMFCIIPIVATINIVGEIAFHIFTKAEGKENIFKIMTIRMAKFLCYLILTLYFTITANNYQEKLFFGLLIVAMFFIYAGVEFGYFRKNST